MADLSLSVPLKRSTAVDFANTIGKQFPKSADLDAAIEELSKLRNSFILKSTSKSQATLESLFRYYDQLVSLSKKLPKTSALNPSFYWENAFEKGSLFSEKSNVVSSSLEFEKCCTLFNIAALQSHLGNECRQVDTDEELKNAAKLFQSSAGIFYELSALNLQHMINDNQTLTTDLHSDTLAALSALMLAQAQEMFVSKAIKGAMKDVIVAKLSVQTVDLFADALLRMTKDGVKHLWERTWMPNVAGKQCGYEAIANFYQSQVCAKNKRVGEQISRLDLCMENLRKAQEKTANSDFLKFYLVEATRLVTEARKDNDFIYHEPIPASANLPTIDRVPTARLAKIVSVPESFSTSFTDLFDKFNLISSTTPVVVKYPTIPVAVISPTTPVAVISPTTPVVVTPTTPTPTPEHTEQTPSRPPRPSRPPPPKVPSPLPPAEPNNGSEPNLTPASSPNAPPNVVSPTLSDIVSNTADALGNYLQNYLFGGGRRGQ